MRGNLWYKRKESKIPLCLARSTHLLLRLSRLLSHASPLSRTFSLAPLWLPTLLHFTDFSISIAPIMQYLFRCCYHSPTITASPSLSLSPPITLALSTLQLTSLSLPYSRLSHTHYPSLLIKQDTIDKNRVQHPSKLILKFNQNAWRFPYTQRHYNKSHKLFYFLFVCVHTIRF